MNSGQLFTIGTCFTIWSVQVLPSREAIDEVERIARSFWGEHPDQYIAIHCAYGEVLVWDWHRADRFHALVWVM